jgi:gamma-glutamylcyclotransferase (GGCT)/AIG2-like uncharacterized protein YtfP
MKLYFAYGSNMDGKQMHDRCPESEFYGIGFLPGYKLGFTRYSENRKSAVADILVSPSDSVWGVIYSVSENGLKTLDKWEGVNSGAYRRISEKAMKYNSRDFNQEGGAKEFLLFHQREKFMKDLANFAEVEINVYEVVKKELNLSPSLRYIDLIIKGAEQKSLPKWYIESLYEFRLPVVKNKKMAALNFCLCLQDQIEAKEFKDTVKDEKEWGGAELIVTGSEERRKQLKRDYPSDVVVFTKYWREVSWLIHKIYYDDSINWQLNHKDKSTICRLLGESALDYMRNKHKDDESHLELCQAIIVKAYDLFTN